MSPEPSIPRQVWRWHSDSFGQTMGVARWGHYGRPVVLFPTGGGDFLDVERFLLVKAVEPLIAAGRIKVYAVDSADRWCWTARDVPIHAKSAVQAGYDRWLVDELVPLVRSDCGGTDQRFACAGASLGAYNAFNAAAKHPDVFGLCIGMSGTYVLDRRMEGHWDEDYYFNSPTRFLPNLAECTQLEQLRTSRFVFAVGAGPHENHDYTRAAAAACASRDIPHRADTWMDGDHDWPTWRRMLPAYLSWLA